MKRKPVEAEEVTSRMRCPRQSQKADKPVISRRRGAKAGWEERMKLILDLSCYPSEAVGPGCGSQEDWGRQDTGRHLRGGAASLNGAGKEEAAP